MELELSVDLMTKSSISLKQKLELIIYSCLLY